MMKTQGDRLGAAYLGAWAGKTGVADLLARAQV
jgi:hypothetical protein